MDMNDVDYCVCPECGKSAPYESGSRYCIYCGADLGPRICPRCGERLNDDATCPRCGRPSAPPRSPNKVIIAIACVVAVAAALFFAIPQMLKGSSDGGDGNNSDNNSIENPSVSQIDGWWQSIGQSGSMYHHMVGGTDYMYRYDQSDSSSPSYVGKRTVVSFDRYAAGEIPAANESCNVVTFDNDGQTFIQYDSSMDTLTCRNPDGSGYSGTSSLAQASNVPEQLLSFAEEAERWSGEPVEYVASAIDLQTGERLLDDNVSNVGAFEEKTVEIPEIKGYEADHAFLIVDGKSVEVQLSDGLLVFAIKEMPKDSALLEIYYRKTDGNRKIRKHSRERSPFIHYS